MEQQTHTPQNNAQTADYVPMLLLCFFLGSFGVHRFYAGRIGSGILMLLTIGGLGIWTLIDFVMIATGHFKDGQGKKIVR
jgi:TM2 domain-containing membrane protein YozV